MQKIQNAILCLFCFSAGGLLIELLLLGHYEDSWQLVPIWLLIATFVSSALAFFVRKVIKVRLFRCLSILLPLSACAGIVLHFRGNQAFELEMYPDMSGWELFEKTISGATPALSPGALFVLGALGWIYLQLLNLDIKN